MAKKQDINTKSPRRGLNQLKQQQRIFQILIFSLVTIVIWVTFSLLKTQRDTSIPNELRELASPLTPTINTEVISELEQKQHYTASDLQSFPIYTILVSKDSGFEQIVTKEERERQIELQNQPSPSPTPAQETLQSETEVEDTTDSPAGTASGSST
jgi:hypothetical protein